MITVDETTEAVTNSYSSTNLTEITDYYNKSNQIQKDLIESRKGVDQAIIYAKRLQTLTYNELAAAKRALDDTIAQKAAAAAEKLRRE